MVQTRVIGSKVVPGGAVTATMLASMTNGSCAVTPVASFGPWLVTVIA